jgi:hypothetical protein
VSYRTELSWSLLRRYFGLLVRFFCVRPPSSLDVRLQKCTVTVKKLSKMFVFDKLLMFWQTRDRSTSRMETGKKARSFGMFAIEMAQAVLHCKRITNLLDIYSRITNSKLLPSHLISYRCDTMRDYK